MEVLIVVTAPLYVAVRVAVHAYAAPAVKAYSLTREQLRSKSPTPSLDPIVELVSSFFLRLFLRKGAIAHIAINTCTDQDNEEQKQEW